MTKKFFLFFTLTLLISTVFLEGCRKREPAQKKGKIELSYYKLFDDEDVMKPFIDTYAKTHPNVSIKYRKFSDPQEYVDLIVNELAEGEGPDIFEVSNADVPRFFKKIYPLDVEGYPPQMVEQNFLSVVYEDFARDDFRDGKKKIYGLPLSVDVPAVYYNKQIFERKVPEQGKPGVIWNDISAQVAKLRELDGEKNLTQGAIAMGRGDNIEGGVDVFLNLLLQEGVEFYNADFTRASFADQTSQKALDFYASFSDPADDRYAWSENIASEKGKELQAFLTGKTAMMIGYSDAYQGFSVALKNLKAQGHSVIAMEDVGIAPLPQKTTELGKKQVLAKYYGQTVSRLSKNPLTAWDFVNFITKKEQAKIYLQKTGKPSARRDLLEEQKKDPILQTFASQVGFAKTIPMYNELKYRELFKEALSKVASKKSSSSQELTDTEEVINDMLPETGLFPSYKANPVKKTTAPKNNSTKQQPAAANSKAQENK